MSNYFDFTSKIKEDSKLPAILRDNVDESESNPIDVIAEELDADRIYLDDLRLDRRMNAKDYEVLMRLPLSAKQLINILYEMYPANIQKKDDLNVSING
jgi:predicted nucleic acid-binding protein